MTGEPGRAMNVAQAVPFFMVANMQASVKFYVDGLGFQITRRWVVDQHLRWCWMELGAAALMLQEYFTQGHDSWQPQGKVGEGVSIYFICGDALALYREFKGRGIDASLPFVGNGYWVTGVVDPDGYELFFESPTDVPEGTVYE